MTVDDFEFSCLLAPFLDDFISAEGEELLKGSWSLVLSGKLFERRCCLAEAPAGATGSSVRTVALTPCDTILAAPALRMECDLRESADSIFSDKGEEATDTFLDCCFPLVLRCPSNGFTSFSMESAAGCASASTGEVEDIFFETLGRYNFFIKY